MNASTANWAASYMNGLDYTPKPPFKPLITHEGIKTKEEEA